jgi:hypothetical protein
MAELRVKETGTIKLFESDNTSSVTIASPASLGADRTITLPDASVTLASGTMLATDGSGASLTALNASELGSGTVPTARLGSGTASSSTILYGDQTYKSEPSAIIGDEIDSYSYNATTATTGATLITNWVRTTGYFNQVGSGITVNNTTGVFTFPSTGYYQVTYKCVFNSQNATSYVQNNIIMNGGSVTCNNHIDTLSDNQYQTYAEALYRVDDTSADTIKFDTNFGGNSNTVLGTTNNPYTGVTFLKLRAI